MLPARSMLRASGVPRSGCRPRTSRIRVGRCGLGVELVEAHLIAVAEVDQRHVDLGRQALDHRLQRVLGQRHARRSAGERLPHAARAVDDDDHLGLVAGPHVEIAPRPGRHRRRHGRHRYIGGRLPLRLRLRLRSRVCRFQFRFGFWRRRLCLRHGRERREFGDFRRRWRRDWLRRRRQRSRPTQRQPLIARLNQRVQLRQERFLLLLLRRQRIGRRWRRRRLPLDHDRR